MTLAALREETEELVARIAAERERRARFIARTRGAKT